MSPEYTIRPATLDDAGVIAHHRRSMFLDMGHTDIAALDRMSAAFPAWLRSKMESNEYLAWLAIAPDHSVAAGAGLWLMDWLPHMIGAGGDTRRGNIVNVYTERPHRQQGLARAVTRNAIEWCRDHNIRTIILHASDQGRPLYLSMGFRPTNEMRIVL